MHTGSIYFFNIFMLFNFIYSFKTSSSPQQTIKMLLVLILLPNASDEGKSTVNQFFQHKHFYSLQSYVYSNEKFKQLKRKKKISLWYNATTIHMQEWQTCMRSIEESNNVTMILTDMKTKANMAKQSTRLKKKVAVKDIN